MAFNNLKAEMAREGISQKQMAEFLGMTPENLRMKFAGRVNVSVPEACAIRDKWFPGLTIDYLFVSDGQPDDRTAG